jgi:CubicO group peptidase (beta-lactamase class C family)
MIDGTTGPRFAGVRQAFASCFDDGLESGAAVAVMLDGELVVDLWGGVADAAGRPWQRDTLVNVWSATKGVVALAVAMLADRGKLDYAAPVARVWPEFAANGKGDITLDLLMSHQAGLNGLSVPMTDAGMYAWHPYVEALAAMAPLWPPGSRSVYHALSYGHLAGEVVRRADGRMPGRFIADEIVEPLGMAFYVGLPAELDHRVAEVVDGGKASDWVRLMLEGEYPHSCRNPDVSATKPNERAWRAAEIPGANGQGDARSLATMYGMLARGGELGGRRYISTEGIARATGERFRGIDQGFGTETAFGAGFRLDDPGFGPAPAGSFGHSGWGGTIAFADPKAGLGFAFVTRNMLGFDDGVDPRRVRLTEAVYAAL